MKPVSALQFICLLLCVVESAGRPFIKVCYFPNWAAGRTSDLSRYDVQHVDPSLCTHLVYAFVSLDGDSHSLVPSNSNDDTSPGQAGRYHQFTELKKAQPGLKTLVSVGGQLAGSEAFLSVTRNDRLLQRFAHNAVHFLRQRRFDGLDIDWEYPNATTRQDFTRLLKALRTEFDADTSHGDRLLLTAALPAGRHYIDTGYDFGALTSYLDLANLMTYDYFGGWSQVTGFDSPLFSRKSDPNFNQELSTEWTVNYYLSKGLPVEKLVVGVTAAGSRFQLKDREVRGVGAPVIRGDTARLSDIWLLPDRYAYPEICRVLQSTLANYTFDEEQQAPYVSLGDDWCGFEDVRSLKSKVKWMLEKGVAGAMFWSLDMDDFTGRLCNKGKYPLLKALNQGVSKVDNPHLTGHVNHNIRYLTKGNNSANRLLGHAAMIVTAVVTLVSVAVAVEALVLS